MTCRYLLDTIKFCSAAAMPGHRFCLKHYRKIFNRNPNDQQVDLNKTADRTAR